MSNNLTQLKLHSLYTKSSLFEAATSNHSLLEASLQPVLDLKISANANPQDQDKGLHEAVLTIELTAKHQDNLLWRVQYQHAGLYTLEGCAMSHIKQIPSKNWAEFGAMTPRRTSNLSLKRGGDKRMMIKREISEDVVGYCCATPKAIRSKLYCLKSRFQW